MHRLENEHPVVETAGMPDDTAFPGVKKIILVTQDSIYGRFRFHFAESLRWFGRHRYPERERTEVNELPFQKIPVLDQLGPNVLTGPPFHFAGIDLRAGFRGLENDFILGETDQGRFDLEKPSADWDQNIFEFIVCVQVIGFLRHFPSAFDGVVYAWSRSGMKGNGIAQQCVPKIHQDKFTAEVKVVQGVDQPGLIDLFAILRVNPMAFDMVCSAGCYLFQHDLTVSLQVGVEYLKGAHFLIFRGPK